MNILVCIKQVPDMEARFIPNADGTWFAETGLAFRMNDYDLYAVEAAVRLKEQLCGAPEVTVLSIGPDRAVEVIRKALALGCDRGVHIRDPYVTERDPWQIASMIAGYGRSRNFELIFTGMQSQDRGSAQVGVLVAEQLGIACVTTIVGFSWHNGTVTAERELEGGTRGVVRLKSPALLTCQLGLNTPRYPTLPNIMKSKKKEITSLLSDATALPGRLSSVTGFIHPERNGSGLVLQGEVSELADRVIAVLKEKTTLLSRGGKR